MDDYVTVAACYAIKRGVYDTYDIAGDLMVTFFVDNNNKAVSSSMLIGYGGRFYDGFYSRRLLISPRILYISTRIASQAKRIRKISLHT